MGRPPKEHHIICFCNNVSKETIEKAIKEGCHTLNDVYDKTTAGVGPCGGSCRRKIAPFLEFFLAHGHFPPDENKKKESNFAGPKISDPKNSPKKSDDV